MTKYYCSNGEIDLGNAWIQREERRYKLTGKATAVLQYLLAQAGQLVKKDDLFRIVWPDVHVGEEALRSCLWELRSALGDDAKHPRCIETVHGRGYRWIAPLSRISLAVKNEDAGVGWAEAEQEAENDHHSSSLHAQPTVPFLVGRETELAQLHTGLAKAGNGERQIVFLTGEPGIGKTSILTAWVAQLVDKHNIAIGHGQCIDHYGVGEAYLPLLSALGQLCRKPEGQQRVQLLAQHAPTWLAQMPALLTDDELSTLQRRTTGTAKERMLRELVEALAVMTAERTLVLVLEDLHWSDPSTLDFLAFLARSQERMRLLVLGTYRPVEMLSEKHPLKGLTHDLYAHELAAEVQLPALTEGNIAAYLASRGECEPQHPAPPTVVRLLYQRTGGNPLFLVALVNEIIARHLLMQTENGWELQEDTTATDNLVPDTIRHLVAHQSGRLSSTEQTTLAAASVAGMEFSAASVAGAVAADTVSVEHTCEQLAHRQQFIQRLGIEEWPDGTLSARYRFLHAVYQQLWHERLTPLQLQYVHRRMGAWKEQAYGECVGEIAAELALHFEQGREHGKVMQYHGLAGQQALQRSAPQEAIAHLSAALASLRNVPASSGRVEQELRLQMTLGMALMSVKGNAAPEVEWVYIRARELCQQLGETSVFFWVLLVLWNIPFNRAEYKRALERAEELLPLAQREPDLALLLPTSLAID